jgi:molybdopterin molybdotransferase
MISVDEALKIILESVSPLASEEVTTIESLGRTLAGDIYSDCDLPAFNYSAMDGFALISSDTKGASSSSGRKVKKVGEHRAGVEAPLRVEKGQAVKIMTGALIPAGADAVIMVENTEETDDCVVVFEEVEKGKNIRLAGDDLRKGDLVMPQGTLIDAACVGMLASLGRVKITVTKRPRVAILATGDEVVGIDEEVRPGKVRNSNAYSLHCQVLKAGGIPVNRGIAADDIENLRHSLKACLDCDIIITSGGVSMGEYDYVRDIMIGLGLEEKFWKVAMRPGKPNLFGVIDGRPFFGLPGNPVSSMVGFEVFIRPALQKMLGGKNRAIEVDAFLQEDVRKKKGLRFFIRALTSWEEGRYVTRTTGPQGSGILSSMVIANSLMILPEDVDMVKQGASVRVRFL